MTIGIILLDQNDYYVSNDGKLPKRPEFDKRLLTELCNGKTLICDGNSLNDLPPSLTKNIILQNSGEVAISPNTIDKFADLLIISRSDESMVSGKQFRLNKFKQIVKQPNLELWIKS